MYSAVGLTILSLAALAAAQTIIMVGQDASAQGGALQFSPSSITAPNGTIVTFIWQGSPGNHTVTQSSFAAPCTPLDAGFDSGYIFVPANTTAGFPTWNLTITNDQEPIWFFCAQHLPVPHCPAGMVGSINAPTTGNHTFEVFQAAAKAASDVGTPVPALSGSGAFATVAPGPITGSFSGLNNPTGSLNASSSGVSGSSTASRSSSASVTSGSSSSPASSVNSGNTVTAVSSGNVASSISNIIPPSSPNASGGSSTASTSGSATPTNAASGVVMNGFFTFVAALLGVTLM
ncbi:hypothetical protein OBBRIDRAFT_137675 [Obba rivulosa]|uniref:Blue (type 1) copper domain-containing protein n=1 Tax=Obba rivulosa TaxID=1052685 RepID=A0A8E2ANW7_9APHY|nr:hypothetical protein OBBRIDRAFT_137675 [Obba rivulosa]